MKNSPDENYIPVPSEAFDRIMAGLEDASNYAAGDTTRGKAHIERPIVPDAVVE